MQPFGAKRGRIRQPLRRDAPLLYERLSDPILVRRANDGDGRALAALCARHQERVHAVARRLLRDPEDARDAAQESLAKLCARLRQFRGESQFTTWLHRLVVNTCRDVAARRRPWDQLVESDEPTAAPEPTATDELRRCLRELPPEQARVVVLKDAFGFSFDEIAAAIGMPVGTAKCYAHRARNRLRDRLAATRAVA